jgi:predicted SprT family Zn-dependent metalloprotease
MEKKNIDLNIKNYLEKNIDVIKNIINDNESYYNMWDLFQFNSKLKLNFFKWCININK